MVPIREARASSLPGHGDNESRTTAAAAVTSSQPVVILHDLVKFFGRFAALRRVSASFAPGKLYVIVGDNGAGKSTLLRVIAGLMQPSQGSVTLLGTKIAREVTHRVGYMGHAPLLYDELDGRENLRYFAGLYGLHDDTICREAMRRVGLDPELERRVGQYSQGMRQRLSLARAVLHDPELILLDEPFSNVDIHSARDMAAILGTVRDHGKTIFVVTHQSALMEQVADEFVHMSAGKIESREPVRTLQVAAKTTGAAR
jgi:ABC-type multidrug transport system ATPase subunit